MFDVTLNPSLDKKLYHFLNFVTGITLSSIESSFQQNHTIIKYKLFNKF
jgi:hypothetical protein